MSQYDDVMNKKAVALRYDENKDIAPVIVASGLGYMAERIVETANENGVPVYEDNSLATVLTQLDLGTAIPEELYQAIVDIYAYFLKYNPEKARQAEEAREAERRAREEAAAREDAEDGDDTEREDGGASAVGIGAGADGDEAAAAAGTAKGARGTRTAPSGKAVRTSGAQARAARPAGTKAAGAAGGAKAARPGQTRAVKQTRQAKPTE